jgi:imidazolonepropionase-like amidohydrolase
MEMLVKAGMTPQQVIVASTSAGAKMMGLKGVGSIEKGNWADLLVLNANPLMDIANARQVDSVYIAGRKVNVAAAN